MSESWANPGSLVQGNRGFDEFNRRNPSIDNYNIEGMSNAAEDPDIEILGAIVYGTVYDPTPRRVEGIVIDNNYEGFTVLWNKTGTNQSTYLYDKIDAEEPWDLDNLPVDP